MERIYHRYENWECFTAGFFNNISGSEKEQHIKNVVNLFSDKEATDKQMRLVLEKWPNSTEHNLTNSALNRVAWLGQSACCLNSGTPSTITMEAWHMVSEADRSAANEVAKIIISEYDLKNNKDA